MEYSPSSTSSRHHHHHHVTPVSHISVSHAHHHEEDALTKAGVSLPLSVRFRDDDAKRGYVSVKRVIRCKIDLKYRKLNRVNDDFNTFELDYKGKTYHSLSSAARELYRYILRVLFHSCSRSHISGNMLKRLAKLYQ